MSSSICAGWDEEDRCVGVILQMRKREVVVLKIFFSTVGVWGGGGAGRVVVGRGA